MKWLSKLFGYKPNHAPEPSDFDKSWESKKKKAEMRARIAAIEVDDISYEDSVAVYDFITDLLQEDRGRSYITQNDLVLSLYWLDKAIKKYIACIAWDKFGDEKMIAELKEIAKGFDSIWLTMSMRYIPDDILGVWMITPASIRPINPNYVEPFKHHAFEQHNSYETNVEYLSFCLKSAEKCPAFDYKLFTRSRSMGFHLKYQAEDDLKQKQEK